MQLLWNILVDVSFGYLGLLAIARIAQELNVLVVPSRAKRAK